MKSSCKVTIMSFFIVVLLITFTPLYPHQEARAAELIVKTVDEKNSGVIARVYSGEFLLGWTTNSGKLKENASGGAHYEIMARKNGYTEESKTVYLPLGGKKSVTLKLEKKGLKKSPTAKFSFSPSYPETGEAVMFDGRDSTVPKGYIDSWHWDFNGDGEVDEKGRIVWNEFGFPGERAISLTVLDSEGRKASVKRRIRIEKSDDQPKADFFYEPKRPAVGEVVRFDGRDSSASEGYIDSWHWDFNGDGEVDEKGRIVWNEFKSSGNKKILLTVVDDQGRASTATEQIKVGTFNQTPNARLEYNPIKPLVNQEIGFNGAISVDKDGEITDYNWAFGDATTSSSKNPTHSYDEPGTYEVKLTVTDDEGATDSTTKQLTVENRKPTAEFTYSPKQPSVGQQVTFDASSSSDPDGTVESYKWDLTGDGDTDKTGSELTYTYEEDRAYEVSLTVTDDYGDSVSTTQEITVTQQQKEEVTIDEKHALVVGVTEYEYHGLNNLNFPAEDARAFYNLLIEEGGFNEENVTLLTNEEATTYRFDKELRRLATETESDDLAVIYYSGHGVQGKDAKPKDEEDGYDEYYVTHNTDPTDGDTIYETAYRDDIFANSVSNIPSDQLAIFLDSCYAGGATKTVKGYTLEGQKDFPTKNDVFSDFDDLDGTALFAASKEDQRSYEPHTPELKEKFGHGVFTYYLLQGLRGEADTDNNGTITIEELKNYVTPSVEEFTEEHFPTPQTPMVKGAISAPLLQRVGKLEGEVKYVKGSGKEEANKGEYVVINLGEEDGVKKGDRFEVYHSPAKGVVFEGLQGKLQVVDVIGSHLATCRLVNSEFSVSKGDKVEKVQK